MGTPRRKKKFAFTRSHLKYTTMGDNKVTLMSSDGQLIEVDREIAEQSVTIKHMLDDIGEEELEGGIPLPNVTLNILNQKQLKVKKKKEGRKTTKRTRIKKKEKKEGQSSK